jgi:hypothetical protein
MAIFGKINTRGVLVCRGILDARDASCPFCLVLEESVDHVLIHCPNTLHIWARFIDWWSISWSCPGNLSDMFQQREHLVHGRFQRKVWFMLFFAISWSI